MSNIAVLMALFRFNLPRRPMHHHPEVAYFLEGNEHKSDEISLPISSDTRSLKEPKKAMPSRGAGNAGVSNVEEKKPAKVTTPESV